MVATYHRWVLEHGYIAIASTKMGEKKPHMRNGFPTLPKSRLSSASISTDSVVCNLKLTVTALSF